MNLLLYANGRNDVGERLRNVIEALVSKRKTEICTTINSLSRRLRKPMYNVDIVVLLAAPRKDLLEIHSMRDLFRDIRIILILPDSRRDTISLGHKLYPRFISYADSDFKDVGAVLKKMIGYINSNNNMR